MRLLIGHHFVWIRVILSCIDLSCCNGVGLTTVLLIMLLNYDKNYTHHISWMIQTGSNDDDGRFGVGFGELHRGQLFRTEI